MTGFKSRRFVMPALDPVFRVVAYCYSHGLVYLSAICPALDTRNVSGRGFYHGPNHLRCAASAGHERRPADRVRVKIKRFIFEILKST